MAVCEICLTHPCLRGCPNEPIVSIGHCRRCGNDIEVGTQYLDCDGYYCEECLDDMPMCELLSMLGYELQTAEREEP